MKNTVFIPLVVLVSFLFSSACSKEDSASHTRTFYMGTTPFPADITVEEVDKVYTFVNTHCDIVSHHINEGIPYEEFYNGSSLPVDFVNNINYRKARTAAGKKVFLSVAALDIDRVSKDHFFEGSQVSEATKEYWENLPFDDPKVITAYVNYINWLINELHPVYVNYGVESNRATWNTTDFNQYKNFLTAVYQQLKAMHPELPFFISFMVDTSDAGLNYANQLLHLTDFMGLSSYPYGINADATSNPDDIPDNFFSRYIELAPDKPLAFAETGYMAQDLIIPDYGLNKQGTPEWQNAYLEKVLQLCEDKEAVLFIWFCPKDYDAMVVTLANQGAEQSILNLISLWRDTGLVDENDNARPAYYTWLKWMDREKI